MQAEDSNLIEEEKEDYYGYDDMEGELDHDEQPLSDEHARLKKNVEQLMN